MSFIVGISFFCMIVSAAIGLEWADVSTVGLVLAALAATIFFSSIDAWECEDPQSEGDEQPAVVAAKAKRQRIR